MVNPCHSIPPRAKVTGARSPNQLNTHEYPERTGLRAPRSNSACLSGRRGSMLTELGENRSLSCIRHSD